ncbi:MAG: tail fiber protein [Acidimicrobiales bacterium]|jgi:microcystin-dependent protein
MADPFLGEIRILPFNFAPSGWALCAGQLLPINQNTALFSLLGTTYGGDGKSTFALPDLRGRVPLSFGQGSGLPAYTLGEEGGSDTVKLHHDQMPAHNHLVRANDGAATADKPAAAVLARTRGDAYAASSDGTTMDANMLDAAGRGHPVSVVQPYLALNFCIALVGIFPSRN